MNKIEELENKMLEIAQEIAELKKSQNAGDWKPKENEKYWFMGFGGEPQFTFYHSSKEDEWIIKNMCVFKTREECQKYCDCRKALSEKSYKFSEAEWKNGGYKYSIEYNYEYCKFDVSCNQFANYICKIYFNTREDAQYMIDNYGEEMLKWGLL